MGKKFTVNSSKLTVSEEKKDYHRGKSEGHRVHGDVLVKDRD